MKNNILNYLIIALVTFAVYFNSLENQFVFDDESVVQTNLSLTSLSNIPKYFTGEDGFHKVIGKYYRPIVSTSYNIDYAIWGLNPFGFHLTNILIHLISTLILFRLLQLLFSNYKNVNLVVLLGTLLFAVHPIHTEAVSWISGRTDSFVTIFFFASFLYYIKFTGYPNSEPDKKSNLYFSLLFFAFGLITKEMIITLPVILILFDYTFRQKTFGELKSDFKIYLYYFIIIGLYLLVRYFALKDIPDRESYMYFIGDNFVTIFSTMVKTIPVYFKLLFYPHPLLYHYNGYLPDSYSFFEFNVIFSVIFIAGLIYFAFRFRKEFPAVSFCILFFFISLLPVMNIIPTMNFMAERFLYLTSIVISILVCFFIVKFINEKNQKIIISVILIITLIFGFMTFQRNKEWKDNDTLYMTADGKDGSVLLVNTGNIFANNQEYDEAEKRYRRAIQIREQSVLAHHNLGLIFLIKENYDSAEIMIKKGILIDSLAPDGYFQLANIYRMQNRIPEAIEQLEKLQQVSPNYKQSLNILNVMKNTPENLDDLNMELNPNQELANISKQERESFKLYNEKKFNESIKILEKLIELDPAKKSGYLNNIGICYKELKEFDKALAAFEEAYKLDGKNINALNGKAEVLLLMGNKNGSIEIYEKIFSTDPSNEFVKSRLDSLKKLKN
ncbi:MAG TPA: tetratricopeptide repeat protein [Ignavibacteria bacterium]|nr:tetratricopeptide repeat protein [Ignavibacteria bacterium]